MGKKKTLGLEPYASYEELMEAYDRLDRQRENGMAGEDEESREDAGVLALGSGWTKAGAVHRKDSL